MGDNHTKLKAVMVFSAALFPTLLLTIQGVQAARDFLADWPDNTWRWLAVAASVILAVGVTFVAFQRRVFGVALIIMSLVGVGLVVIIPAFQAPSSAAGKPSPTSSQLKPPTVTTSKGTAQPSLFGINSGTIGLEHSCGPLAKGGDRPLVVVRVRYWCKGDVYKNGAFSTTQIQIKLRPEVENNGDLSLDVRNQRPSAFLLALEGKDVAKKWDPPPKTRAHGDSPRIVNLNGRQYWAIPPNINGDYRAAGNGMYDGFSTNWHGTWVEPGQRYSVPLKRLPSGANKMESDLVFQVPLDDLGQAHVVGLVLVDRKSGGVLACHPFTDWGPSSDPASF